jgi:DNA replication protein DnaC
MKYLMENSGIPKKCRHPIYLDGRDDPKSFKLLADIKDDIVNFVDNGESLYIFSEYTGNGKTSWAIKLLLKYFDSIWAGNGFRVRGYFQHVPTLFNVLKDFSKSHEVLKNTLETVDLVVWDDIAAAKLSDYDIQQLLIIIDSRVSEGLANIFTGNLISHEALQKAVGDRLASRIWHTSTLVEFKGKDRRSEWRYT